MLRLPSPHDGLHTASKLCLAAAPRLLPRHGMAEDSAGRRQRVNDRSSLVMKFAKKAHPNWRRPSPHTSSRRRCRPCRARRRVPRPRQTPAHSLHSPYPNRRHEEGEMPHMNRRELVGAAGVVAAAGLAPAVAAAATGKSHNEGPTLPKSDESNKFDFARIEPQVVRPGGTVKECTGENFPVLVDNAAASFLLVLEPGAVREPHWHPNAWELDVP